MDLFAGTLKERGIADWLETMEEDEELLVDAKYPGGGYEVYEPLLPNFVRRLRILKYFPFLPNPKRSTRDCQFNLHRI